MSKHIKANHAQLEQVLNYLLEQIGHNANPEFSFGRGMRVPHLDSKHVVVESVGGRGGGGGCKKWSVQLSQREGGGAVAVLKSGSINGIVASNQGEEVKVSSGDGDIFLVGKVIVKEGAIESWTFAAQKDQPSLIPSNDGYPSDFTFLIHARIGGIGKTIWCGDVIATPTLAFYTAKSKPRIGEEPFVRNYTWRLEDGAL